MLIKSVSHFLQIVLGGRNKYLINGCNANNTRVQDLFRSVQLNINNPHFLIMQVIVVIYFIVSRPVNVISLFFMNLLDSCIILCLSIHTVFIVYVILLHDLEFTLCIIISGENYKSFKYETC